MKSEQIKEITEKATEQLVAALQAGHSEALTSYLKAIGRFHRYSLHNVMLIASQKPNASYVAGFRTWNQLGRFVKKGEKGILILAPIVRRKAENSENDEKESSRIAASAPLTSSMSARPTGRTCRRLEPSTATHANTPMVSASLPPRRISRSSTRKTSRQPAVLRMADGSSASGPILRPRSSRHSSMNSHMNCFIVATAANKRRAKSARRKPRRPPLSSARPSGSKPVRPHATTSSCGMEIHNS